MALLRFSFFSHLTAETAAGRWHDLSDIVVISREHNKKHGFTGIMISDERIIFQCLEGDDVLLGALFQRIMKDERHGDVEVVAHGPARARMFETWDVHFRPLHRTPPPPPLIRLEPKLVPIPLAVDLAEIGAMLRVH
jgi:hypothetical protein